MTRVYDIHGIFLHRGVRETFDRLDVFAKCFKPEGVVLLNAELYACREQREGKIRERTARYRLGIHLGRGKGTVLGFAQQEHIGWLRMLQDVKC